MMGLFIECGTCRYRHEFESEVSGVTIYKPTKQELVGVLLPPGWKLEHGRFNCHYCVPRFAKELDRLRAEAERAKNRNDTRCALMELGKAYAEDISNGATVSSPAVHQKLKQYRDALAVRKESTNAS